MEQATSSSPASYSPSDEATGGIHDLGRWILRWVLFFLICLGLGYATVERYDPRTTPGLSDSTLYYRLVAGEEVQARDLRFRVLVPYVARPFYLLARRGLDPERSVYLGLLIANSIFCATTACLLLGMGIRVTGSLAVAFLAVALYLLNFAIPNLQLAGMIDAGEACFIMAVTVTLFGRRWWLLPLWGLFGALAKETFVPLAGMLALVWWFVGHRSRDDRVSKLIAVTLMLIVSSATVIGLHVAISGHVAVSEVASNSVSHYFSALIAALLSRNLWYVFVWLLPLGLMRLPRLPRPWVVASVSSALVALCLGVYRDIADNIARPMFDVIGPVLSLSIAILLSRHSGHQATASRREELRS